MEDIKKGIPYYHCDVENNKLQIRAETPIMVNESIDIEATNIKLVERTKQDGFIAYVIDNEAYINWRCSKNDGDFNYDKMMTPKNLSYKNYDDSIYDKIHNNFVQPTKLTDIQQTNNDILSRVQQ